MTCRTRELVVFAGLLLAGAAAAQGATRVMLVQIGVDGGDAFGCGDRILAVPVGVAKGADPLRVALDQLLVRGADLASRNGLYDALQASDLSVRELVIEGSAVIIHLDGTLRLHGECDGPRVREQLYRTVLQYREFRTVRVLVDGVDLEELLGLSR